MARSYYHSRTAENAVAYDAQVKREAFWTPIAEAGMNVFAFFMFVIYAALVVSAVAMTGMLLYALAGFILSFFGVQLPAPFTK